MPIAPWIAVPIAMTGLGLAMGKQIWPPVWRAVRTGRWLAVDGRIVHAGVSGSGTDVPYDGARALKWANAHIHYEYAVNGCRYQSERVNFTGHSFDSAIATGLRYNVGETVTVWYDPFEPSESVLDRDVGIVPWLWAAAAALIFALGSLILVIALVESTT